MRWLPVQCEIISLVVIAGNRKSLVLEDDAVPCSFLKVERCFFIPRGCSRKTTEFRVNERRFHVVDKEAETKRQQEQVAAKEEERRKRKEAIEKAKRKREEEERRMEVRSKCCARVLRSARRRRGYT